MLNVLRSLLWFYFDYWPRVLCMIAFCTHIHRIWCIHQMSKLVQTATLVKETLSIANLDTFAQQVTCRLHDDLVSNPEIQKCESLINPSIVSDLLSPLPCM